MYLDFCTWSCSYSTCLGPHSNFLVSRLTLRTCQLMISMHHVHFHHTAWPAQKVYLSSLWLLNSISWSFLHISLYLIHYLLLHLFLEFIPLLSDILGCPCIWKFTFSFTSAHQNSHNLHWTLCILWLLTSPLFPPLGLMSSSSTWGVTSRLIKLVKKNLSRVMFLSFFSY